MRMSRRTVLGGASGLAALAGTVGEAEADPAFDPTLKAVELWREAEAMATSAGAAHAEIENAYFAAAKVDPAIESKRREAEAAHDALDTAKQAALARVYLSVPTTAAGVAALIATIRSAEPEIFDDKLLDTAFSHLAHSVGTMLEAERNR